MLIPADVPPASICTYLLTAFSGGLIYIAYVPQAGKTGGLVPPSNPGNLWLVIYCLLTATGITLRSMFYTGFQSILVGLRFH